ncbi:MAG: trimethylamine methyltransferase, partial [Mesorhizobium sp.]
FEQWRDAGELDASQRAHVRWKKLLAEYEEPALDAAIDEALSEFVAQRKAQNADQWY